MQTVSSVAELRAAVKQAKQNGKTVGFVPTMGNLHEGHISLVHAAREHADFIIASIFVNPMQFGANEDLGAYPRTLADDQAKLAAAKTDILFTPTVSEMYPHGLETQTVVAVPQLSMRLCGQSRPGHFEGVATVVSKLFNMVQPDVAAFGQKDFQQVMVIEQMVEDLNLPIRIVPVATARAESGLALSSRNGYLSDDEIEIAAGLYKELHECRYAIMNSNVSLDALTNYSAKRIEQQGMQIDYFEICERRGLVPATERGKDLVILAAVKLGKTRLIDNLEVAASEQ